MSKTIDYAYPSSTTAQRLKHAATGCYFIALGELGFRKAIFQNRGFSTKHAAAMAAKHVPLPWSAMKDYVDNRETVHLLRMWLNQNAAR